MLIQVVYQRPLIRNPSQLSDIHPGLSQPPDPFLCRLVSTTELWPLVSNLLASFLWTERSNYVRKQQLNTLIFQQKTAYHSFSVLHLEWNVFMFVSVSGKAFRCLWGSGALDSYSGVVLQVSSYGPVKVSDKKNLTDCQELNWTLNFKAVVLCLLQN